MPLKPNPYAQAAAAAVGGPSDDALRELVAAQDAAREVAPDEAQQAYQQAAREQVPFGAALDRLRTDPKRQGYDWEKLAKDAPTLARVVAEDEGFAAAAQNDVEKLSRLEQLVRGVKSSRGAELAKTVGQALEGATSAPEATFHRAAQGRRVDQIGNLAWQQVMGDASPETEKLVAELEKANASGWNPKLGFVAGMAPAAAEQIAMMAGRLERSADLAIGGLLGGAAAGGAAGAAALGVGAVPGAAAGSLAGLGAGVTAGQMREGGAAEGGLAFREFLQVPGVDRNAARVGAVIVAAVNGGLEALPIARLLGRIPGLGRLAKTGLVKDAVRRVLASPTKAAAFTRLSARIVEQGLFEGVTEYAQEWSNILNGEVAVELSQPDANLGRLGGRLGRAAENPANRERAAESFVAGAQAGLALGGAGNALSLRAELQEAKAAEQRLAFYRSLGETVQSADTAKIPEAMQAFAKRLREESGGAVEEFSAPAEDLQRLFQEEGLDDADIARLMPTVARGLAEAAKAGDPRAEVVIPFEDFIAHVAPLKSAEALHENLRMGDSLTAAEAKDVVKQAEKLRAEKPKKGAAEELSPSQRVYNDVFKKLVGSGAFTDEIAEQDAAIWAAVAESRASRGVAEDAWAYYQKQQLSVGQGEAAGGLEQRAYHGTPHRGIERFSLQKMGSGEGAQVYGWGLYFAGNKEVGEYYRERLSGGRGMRRALRFGDFVAARPTGAGTLDPDQQLAAMLYGRVDLGRSVAEVRAELADEAAAAQDPEDRRHYERLLEAYDRMAAHGEPRVEEAGQLYGVDLPEDTDLLDYDKPISDQPPGVLSALRRAGLIGDMDSLIQRTEEINKLAEQMLPLSSKSDEYKRLEREFDTLDAEVKALERELGPVHYLTGERLYRNLEKKLGSPRAASEALLEAGIPGMRYLDAGSRGGGDGTANFVVWDESLIDITRTYYQRDDQTETPEFKAWFGDSKVADADGRPLVVYHGTKQGGFETFDAARQGALDSGYLGKGFYFARNPRIASVYATESGAVYPVFLKLENPLDLHSEPDKQYPNREEDREITIRRALGLPRDATADQVTRTARAAGHDGVRYWARGETEPGELVVFEPTQIKSATGNRGAFDPNNPSILGQDPAKGTVRGSVEFDSSREWFKITLTGRANLSTFLHESAHAFFEMLSRDAEAGHAESAADVATLRAWTGAAEGEPLATEHLEKIARGFEAYLWEGKAPSVELRGVFSRLKAWLRHVYRAITSLNVELTDEVRGVFDRLLATEDAITEAHARLALEAFPGDEKAAELHAKALDAAELDLEREALSVWRRAFAADYERVRGEVEAETEASPAYNAWEVLAGRERLDSETVPEELQGRKLSKAAIKGMALDREARRRIGPLVGKDHKNGTSDAMIDPGAAAPFFGFDSGVELVRALAALEPRARYVKAETDRRLAEKYPGYDADPAWLEQKALEALHGDPVAKALRLDLEATGRQVGAPPARSVAEAAKLLAHEHVDGLTGLELQPDRYRRAEVKAAREWQQLVAAKKFEEAWAAKRAQIYNHFAWKRAAEARDEFEKTRTYLLGLTDIRTRKKIGLAGQIYLQAIDALLDRLELRKASAKQLGRRASLASYLRQIEAEGEPVLIPPELAAETTLRNYRTLTVAEFRALGDAAKNIEHLARTKNRLRLGKEQRDFARTTTELAEHIKARAGADFAVPANAPPNPRAGARLLSWLRTGSANLKKMEFVARALDGGEIAGFAHSTIFQPIADAEGKKAKMLKEVVLKLGEIFDGLTWRDAARMDEEVDFLGVPMRRSEVLASFLNMGNAGNKARLFGGAKTRGWAWSEEAALVRFDELLTDRDLELAQQIWDTINSLWPEIVALQERVVGVAPEKVEATPVMLPSGRKVAGGYYPVVKDPRASHLGAKIASRKADAFENQFMLPITAHGFTEARGDDLTSPLLLDLRVIPSHLTEVIHYLTHYEAVRAVDKLTQSKPVRAAIVEALGQETYAEIRPWLQAVAHDGDVAERTAIDAGLRHLRFGATFVMYGFKASTALMQSLGLSQTIKEIGIGSTAAGAGLFFRHVAQLKPFAAEAESGALEALAKGYDREVRQIFDSHVGGFSKLGKLRHEVGAFSLAFLGLVQRSVNAITWLGARERAFEQGHPDPVAYADAVVRQSQSSGSIKDLASIQRGPETLKLFTVAYSYFSVLYNQMALPLERGVSPKAKVAEAAARWWWLVTLPVVAEELMRGKAPEDDEIWAKWFALQQMLYVARSVPMLSSVTEAAAGGMEPRTAPWLSAVYRSAVALGHAGDPEQEMSAGDVRALVDVAGMVGHAPTGAANNAWRYLNAFSDGTMEEPVRNLILRGPREWK